MKKWLYSLALAGSAAASVALGALSASAVSFTVVIDKIELMENGNSSIRHVIYNPVSGIGASATSTLDLLNANKSGALLSVAAPRAGTYRTMLITFGDVRVSAETGAVSATQSLLGSLGTAQGFGTELGRTVLIMGDPGTGGASISALLNGGIAFATVPPMQPVVSNGSTVALPAFNFFLPAANVVTSGADSVNVTTLPVPLAISRADTDSAEVPNVVIGVKGAAFDGADALPANVGNFSVRVGLFRNALDLKPVYVRTATIVSNSLTTAASITEVSFLDVADGTYIPLAWIDANNNGLLDSGEATIMSDAVSTALNTDAARLTINKEDLFGIGAAGTISSTSAAFDVSAAGAPLGDDFGAETANGYLGESGGFYAFPARAISITLTTSSAASVTLDDDTIDCGLCSLRAVWAGGDTVDPTTAAAAVTLTIGGVTAPSILFRLDHDDTSTEADNTLNDDDLLRLVAITNAENGIDAIDGFTLMRFASIDPEDETEINASLVISPVPLATLVNIDQDTAYGTYSVGGSVRALDPLDTNLGAADAFTLSNVDVALGSGDHDAAAANVTFTSKVITATLGN